MRIYFIGIAGAVMASLALYLSEAGHDVSGSDSCASDEVIAFWRSRNVQVHVEQRAENLGDVDLVVYSAAIPPINPERQEAEHRGIGISRGQALAQFANAHTASIAVCGTHGKGTTAAAISAIFAEADIPADDILGAVPLGRKHPSTFDAASQYLVCEVDESDRTHLCQVPRYLVLNNVEVDHLNHYRDLDDIVDTFVAHVQVCLKASSRVLIHYAGVGASMLHERLARHTAIFWIAEEGQLSSPSMAYRVIDVDGDGRHLMQWREADGQTFSLRGGLGGFANAQNLMTAAALARLLGIPADTIATALQNYGGLCHRCQRLTTQSGITLVTNYASHPTCIANDIRWHRAQAKRIVALYHPFRYSFVGHHWQALVHSLSLADIVLLPPLDGAGEPPVEGIDSQALAQSIAQIRPACQALAFDDLCSLESDAQALIRPGDYLIVFAGGSIFDLGRRLVGI